MEKDTKAAILTLLEALRESMKGTSEKSTSSLRMRDALVEARLPGYLEPYEGSHRGLFST
jgi:hypothetical protein